MGVGGSSPLNPTKSTQRECFFFVLSCPWTIASSTAFGRRTTFRSARCAFANTFARLLLSESTHKAKSTQSECFFFVLSCPWTIASSTAFGRRTTFRSARCAFANTFARLLLSESTHKAKSTQSECFFFVLSCPWTIASSTAFNMRSGGGQAPPSRP